MALLFVFLLWSWFCHWLIVSRFCLWGWYIVWFLSPSSPDPYLVFVCVPLLLFCLIVFVDAVFPFLFLSGAGETQTPFGEFGVPLVFLRAGRDRPLRSVHLPLHLHQGHRPHLFFFLFRRRRSFSGLGVFWFLVFVVVGFLAVQDDTIAFRWGRETRHLPPLRTIIITAVFGFG